MTDATLDIIPATLSHLPEILALMKAGAVGARVGKEADDPEVYRPAFEAILAAPETTIYVVVDTADGRVAATYQLTFSLGLGFRGLPRAVVESVHTRADLRGRGIGARMMQHAEDRARNHGCCLIQLTSNSQRKDAHRFYVRLGFEQSHLGFKKML